MIYVFVHCCTGPWLAGMIAPDRWWATSPERVASQVECPRCQGKPSLYGTLEPPRVAEATEAS
jgi:hypothetical protein